MMRDFKKPRKVVVKVGTNLLSSKDGIDEKRIGDLVRQIAHLKEMGIQVLLVSSGAVGMGAKKMGHVNPVVHIPLRQAYAAIGMPLLMSVYEREFLKYNIITAQVLITRTVLENRKSYINLRSSVSTLLALGVVPVFNENDVVSTSEINNNFGDNDRLSAYIASKIDADLLVLLTDIDGLYTKNPKTDEDAELIKAIDVVDQKIFSYAKGKGSVYSTGGMKTKLLAAKIAQEGGCGTVIASGFDDDVLIKIVGGEDVGTYILPQRRLSQKARWIKNASAEGTIVVDEGAKKALLMHSSLLSNGILRLDGVFEKGSVVNVATADGNVFLKAVPRYNSTELEGILKEKKRLVVFRPEESYGEGDGNE